ncbi:MAG: GDSL-type esterase/lipase family protein [Planctomycetota bacterium]
MTARPSRRAPPLAPLLVGLALAALLIAALELGLRLAGYGPSPGDFYFARLGERILEPEMYEGHPRRFFTLRADYRHSPAHAGPNAVGSWPFRGRPLAPAPADLWTVAVLGDSCAYGLPLPANQALPARLDHHLRESGIEALVANLGVPGYTTVQIRALLDEVLAEHAPDEVVLYPAAWNDQAPALGHDDVELRERAENPGLLRRSALIALLRGEPGQPAEEGTAAPAPSDEERERGTRVPEEAVEGELRAMIHACRERGVGVVLIVPPHPPRTRSSHARMFRDAETVRRVAGEEGVDAVDLQPLLDEGLGEDAFFADLVHPAPTGVDLLAVEAAGLLLARAPAAPSHAALAVRSFEPTEVPELGDLELKLRLDGWTSDAPLPAVTVAGAPLLDLRAHETDGVRGTLPHVGPGPCTVVVQTSTAVAVAAEPLIVRAPSIEWLAGEPPRVRVRSRAGDAARVLVARELREHAKHSSRGGYRLVDEALLPLHLTMELGADGTGEATVRKAPAERPLYLQALIVPAGEPEDSDFAVWSAVTTVP